MSFLLMSVVLVVIIVVGGGGGTSSEVNELRYHRNEVTGELWRLVWADEFDSANGSGGQPNRDDWIVEHETQFCSGNGIQQLSCNTNRTNNVRVESGRLVLAANHEDYYQNHYTAGTITTRKYFTYGRYEIRAVLPVADYIRSTIFTRNEHESYWHENGQIDVMSNTGEAVIHRGVHFANTTSTYKAMDHVFIGGGGDEPIDLTKFHTYGVEWNETSLRFFIDDLYSPPVVFTDPMYQSLKPFHQLRLQIGVGGILVKRGAMPEDFGKLAWSCPAFIIDYVRIFEPVVSPLANVSVVDLHLKQTSPQEDTTITQEICSRALEYSKTPAISFKLSSTSMIIVGIITLLVLFLTISAYLVYQLRKVKQTVKEVDAYGINAAKIFSDQGHAYEDGDVYQVIDYDYPEDKDGGGDGQGGGTPRMSNEYLELNDSRPKVAKVVAVEAHTSVASATDTEGHEYLCLSSNK